MDDPTPLGQYLGCNHIQSTITLPNGVKARAVSYDMEDFLDYLPGSDEHIRALVTSSINQPRGPRRQRPSYGNFDIILGPVLAHCSAPPTPHAPCAVLYLVPMLIGC